MRPITTFRNPLLSLWQSAIHSVVSEADPQAAARLSSNHPMMAQFVAAAQAFVSGLPAPRTDELGDIIEACARLAVQRVGAEILHDQERITELTNELRMSTCDPGWARALASYLEFRKSGGTIPYIRYTNINDFVIPIPNNVTVAFISDCGTGAEDARSLLSQVMRSKPDVLIHLGDIYYSGTPKENLTNFLSIVRPVAGDIPVYSLSGNHDMYSGGQGYYGLIAQLGQPASYFCLRNDHWQLLAMDTGLHDDNPFTIVGNVTYLDAAEAEWHLDKLANADGRRSVLLSHHQLFSAVSGVGQDGQGKRIAFNPHLQGTFVDYLSRIALWLWGHEHNLIAFDPYLDLKRGRCIGSGAIPMMVDQEPYTPYPDFDLQGQSAPPIMNLQATHLSANEDGFYYHAYAIMRLDGPDARVDYYQADSINNGDRQLLFSERVSERG